MAADTPLTEEELRQFAVDWYRKLDVHVPVEEILPLIAAEGAEFRFPEATERGPEGFTHWYERVIRIFFDEVHTVKEVTLTSGGDTPQVKVVVNWQAKVWEPPAPKSKWLGFDAYQTWIVQRSPQTGKPTILTYIVDSLDPMEGSATL